MSDFFLFFRFWPGFSDPFPFDRFNALPDDELETALNVYADELSRSPEVQDEIKQRRQQRIEAIRSQAKQLVGPRRSADLGPVYTGPVYDPRLDPCLAAVCRIGSQLGWWRREVEGMTIPCPRVWIYESHSMDLVEYLVMEKLPRADELNRDEVVDKAFVNPRFGVIAAETMSKGDQALARRCIVRLERGELPPVPFPEVAETVANWSHKVSAEIGEVWTPQEKIGDGKGKGRDKEANGGRPRKWDNLRKLISVAAPTDSDDRIAAKFRQYNPQHPDRDKVDEQKVRDVRAEMKRQR